MLSHAFLFVLAISGVNEVLAAGADSAVIGSCGPEGCHHSFETIVGSWFLLGSAIAVGLFLKGVPAPWALLLMELPVAYCVYHTYVRLDLFTAVLGAIGLQLPVLFLMSIRDPHGDDDYFSFLKRKPEPNNAKASDRPQSVEPPVIANTKAEGAPAGRLPKPIRETSDRAVHGRVDITATPKVANRQPVPTDERKASQLATADSTDELRRILLTLPTTAGYLVMSGQAHIRFVLVYGENLQAAFDGFITWMSTTGVKDAEWLSFSSHGFYAPCLVKVEAAADFSDASCKAYNDGVVRSRIKPGSVWAWPACHLS